MAQIPLKSIKFPGLPDTYTVDPGLSEEAKAALLACFQHVAWIDEHGGSYHNALRTALYSEGGSTPVISEYPRLLASYSPPSYFKLYIGDSISILKNFLTVTLYTSASESEVITEYELSGSINNETNVINVTYNGITTSFYAVAENWTLDMDCLIIGNFYLPGTSAEYVSTDINRLTFNPLFKRFPIGTYALSCTDSDIEYGVQFVKAADPKLYEASGTLLTEGVTSTVWTGSMTKNFNVSGFPGGYQTGNRTFEITDPETFVVFNARKKNMPNITPSLKQQIKSALTIIKTA